MRVQVNLATRPFVELRPFFLRLRLWMAGLVLLGVAIALGSQTLSVRAARQQAELDRVRDQTIAAQEAKLHTERRMREPGNAAVLDRAHFLNALFLRKSFSWTAVMMDLENVLPTGVQVTSIEPAVTADGTVVIRLRVAGERDRAVQLVRNLERSRRFRSPRLGSESAQNREVAAANGTRPGQTPTTQGPPGVEFEILADYNPLPAGEAYPIVRHRAEMEPAARVPPRLAPVFPRAAPASGVNARNGYPAGGVVLPPYAGPARGAVPPRYSPPVTFSGGRPTVRPNPPVGAQSGGGPR